MEKLDVIHQRNKLLVKLFSFSVAVFTIFSSINSCTESEAVSIQEVSASMDATNYNVIEISKAAVTFSDYSNGTVDLVNNGNVFITTLAAEIGNVGNTIGQTVSLMEEVNNETQLVGEILEKIKQKTNNVSTQITSVKTAVESSGKSTGKVEKVFDEITQSKDK
jgi:methyl-accepting chemotaxis protein